MFELLIISSGSHDSAVIDEIHVSSGNREERCLLAGSFRDCNLLKCVSKRLEQGLVVKSSS